MKYENPTKYLVIAFLLAFIILALCSCGTRKVNKSTTEIKEVSKTETSILDTSKTVTKTNINIKIVEDKSTDEFIVEAVDTSKVSIFEGKQFKNARLTNRKTNSNKVVDKKETSDITQRNSIKIAVKEDNSKTTNIAVKNTEKITSYWWLLWFLLLIPIYYGYRFVKNYHLNVKV